MKQTQRYVQIGTSRNGEVMAKTAAWEQRTKMEGNNEN